MGDVSFPEWFAEHGYYLLYGISLFTFILFLIFYIVSKNKNQIKRIFMFFAMFYVFIGIPVNAAYYLIRHLVSDMAQWQVILGIIIGTLTSTILIFYRKGYLTVYKKL